MTATTNPANLQAALDAVCDAQPFITRYLVRNIRTGENFGRRENEQTPSASTRKTSIMMAALSAASEGALDLKEPIVYEKHHAEEVASGIFRHLTPGIVISLQDAISGMMVLSDNVCTRMVFERLKLAEVDAYCQSIGMAGTHHRFLIPPLALQPDHTMDSVTTTTAADQVMLLHTILAAQDSPQAAGKLRCSPELCRFALKTLRDQVLRYGIHSRLPFETVVASKGGRGRRGRMDAGIVYKAGEPLFIIAAYTDEVPQAMADGTPGYTMSLETIGKLARTAWDALQ